MVGTFCLPCEKTAKIRHRNPKSYCNQKQETDKGNDNKRQTTNPNGEGDDPNLEISFENPSEKNSSQRKH